MVDQALAEAIARGEVKLLGVDEIITRLNVSRSTFERWLRNGRSLKAGIPRVAGFDSYSARLANSSEGNISFPEADVMIGKSPRWEEKTLVKWIIANTHKNVAK